MTGLDIPRVMEIWLSSTIQGHPFLPEEYWYRNYETVKNVWLPASQTFVDVRDDVVLGFVSVHNERTIGALFVDFEHQGLGIGTALINHLKTLYGMLELEVYQKNKGAVHFYKRKGFAISGEKPSDNEGQMLYMMSWIRQAT